MYLAHHELESIFNISMLLCAAGREAAAARASMLAINEMTADAMLGTPDSDLWHNVDDLLHNVNDLMSRLDQRQGDEGSQGEEQEEADGVFFTLDAAPSGNPEEASAAVDGATADYATPYTEVQVCCSPPFGYSLYKSPAKRLSDMRRTCTDAPTTAIHLLPYAAGLLQTRLATPGDSTRNVQACTTI